jgi:hypothetical protein
MCTKGWKSAQDIIFAFLEDNRKKMSPFVRFSDIQIDCVNFDKEVPVRVRTPSWCKNTNMDENLTDNNAWTPCKKCALFHTTHWYIAPEDNHPPTVVDLPVPALTLAEMKKQAIIAMFMGEHKPWFKGIGYVIVSPGSFYPESWGECFRSYDDALYKVTEHLIGGCGQVPWCDIQIKRVDFSCPVPIRLPLGWGGCANTNGGRNTTGSLAFVECGDCALSGRTCHWYIARDEGRPSASSVTWAPPSIEAERGYAVYGLRGDGTEFSIGFIYKTVEEAKRGWELFSSGNPDSSLSRIRKVK